MIPDAYEVKIPGKFWDLAYLDLETVKVPAPEGFQMRNGELLRQRWSVLMAGVVKMGSVWLLNPNPDEGLMLERIGKLVGRRAAVYAATRQFDEMILRGRFTNARRAHELVPFFPAMPGAEGVSWVNVYKERMALHTSPGPLWRGQDVPSKGISAEIRAGGERYQTAVVHLLRDVVELIVVAGEPDPRCLDWCREVLSTMEFAREVIPW